MGLLSERSHLYRNREKGWVHPLRAYILVTLADIGVPAGAKPYILDFLTNSDKTPDLGWVYTVVAGMLNILVIYDAAVGPAFVATAARPEREPGAGGATS